VNRIGNRIGNRNKNGKQKGNNEEKITGKRFVEIVRFQQLVKHLVLEGEVPVPPNRPRALRWWCSTFPGIITPKGMPQRRGRRHHVP